MKSLVIYFTLLLTLLTSCEDVVDIDLKDNPPKLVIEALIGWEKGTPGNEQTIKLRQSSSFFKEEIINATGATVTITKEDGAIFNFNETSPGNYTTSTFIPEIDATYTLNIEFEGQQYTAVETMRAVAEIKRVEQRIENFADEEIPVVVFYFDDPKAEENFYLVNYLPDFQEKKSFGFGADEFQNGNEIEIILSSEYIIPDSDEEIRDFTTGDTIELSLFAISKQFNDYFTILTEQADPGSGPFSLAPAAAKGNCLNITNPENRPFGYFRLSEVDKETYIYK